MSQKVKIVVIKRMVDMVQTRDRVKEEQLMGQRTGNPGGVEVVREQLRRRGLWSE